jgi:hypothetical protein
MQDTSAGVALCHERIGRAEIGAELVVLCTLREAVQNVAARMPNFTTDDITDSAAITPREPRVLGAVMLWAQKQGLCLPTGNYKQSRHRECHKRPKMVWRSQVFEQQ